MKLESLIPILNLLACSEIPEYIDQYIGSEVYVKKNSKCFKWNGSDLLNLLVGTRRGYKIDLPDILPDNKYNLIGYVDYIYPFITTAHYTNYLLVTPGKNAVKLMNNKGKLFENDDVFIVELRNVSFPKEFSL